MLTAFKLALLLVVPPSLFAASGQPAGVPLYFGIVNVVYGFRFWRYRRASMMVVLGYILSGMLLFRFLVDPATLAPLPHPPPDPGPRLAGTPQEQAELRPPPGSRWTDWMRAEGPALPGAQR